MVKRITQYQYDKLNNRIEKVTGLHKKINSQKDIIKELLDSVLILKRSIEILEKQVDVLKSKSRNIPKKIYHKKI